MDNKKESVTTDVLIADILLRLTTLEKMLISKGIILEEEYKIEMNKIAAGVAKTLLQKSKVQGDLDKIVSDLQKENKNIKN